MAGAGPEERKQAGEIKIRSRTCDSGQAGVLPEDASKPVQMLVVTNTSTRPIRNLAAQIYVSGASSAGPKLADVTGRIEQMHVPVRAATA